MAAEPKKPKEKRTPGAWRGRALNEAERLADRLSAVRPPETAEQHKVIEAITRNIERARAAAGPRGRIGRLFDWFSGVPFEKAWSSLQAADELLALCEPWADLSASTADLLAALEANLKQGDSRLRSYRKILDTCAADGLTNLTDVQRATIRAARHTANTAAYVSQGVVRRWRNLLLAVGFAVGLAAVVLAIVHEIQPEFLPLDAPSGGSNEVWQVELLGAFGGAIGAVLAINRFSGYTDPNGLPLYQALLRIPMAAAVSLLGVLLLQSGIIDALKPQPTGAVLAYAVLFGYAQEPLLRAIDRKAGEILGPARGKDDPLNQPAAPKEA
jgi:hypothetical protein